MPSGGFQSDQNIDNLFEQIKDLQERLTQLERHALTSQDIVANNIAVDKLAVGSGVSVDDIGTGDIITADQIFAGGDVRVRGGGTNLAFDDSTLSQRIEGVPHNYFTHHFDGNDYPMSGFSWQTYSPFATPSPDAVESASNLRMGADSVSAKAFYAKSGPTGFATTSFFKPFQYHAYNDFCVGLRWDDGSNANYTQVLWRHNTGGAAGYVNEIVLQHRVASGAVNESISAEISLGVHPTILCTIEGTLWSSWTLMPVIYFGNANVIRMAKPYSNSFTPTRMGLYWDDTGSSASWQLQGFDAVRIV